MPPPSGPAFWLSKRRLNSLEAGDLVDGLVIRRTRSVAGGFSAALSLFGVAAHRVHTRETIAGSWSSNAGDQRTRRPFSRVSHDKPDVLTQRSQFRDEVRLISE